MASREGHGAGSVADRFLTKHLGHPGVKPLPEPPSSTWRIIGPGIIAAGVGLAPGEFTLYPDIASQVGLVFVWVAPVGLLTPVLPSPRWPTSRWNAPRCSRSLRCWCCAWSVPCSPSPPMRGTTCRRLSRTQASPSASSASLCCWARWPSRAAVAGRTWCACTGGLMMFIYSGLLILINRRLLPEQIRITSGRIAVLCWSIALFGILSALTIVTQFGKLLGG